MKRILLSILVSGILLLSACGTPTTAPSTEAPAAAPPTERQTYTLSTSVSPSGAGSVAPSDGQYEEGTLLTLTAIPASGYAFDYWDGDASGSSITITLTMDSDKSITAHFKVIEAEPTPAKFVVTNLQVIPSPDVSETSYSISVDIENTGGLKGIYQLISKVDDEGMEPIEVELNPNEKKTVTLSGAQTEISFLAMMYRITEKKGKHEIEKEHVVSVDGLSVTVTFPEPPSEPEPTYKLQLLSTNDERAYDYITIYGQVKNISNESLENVMAVVEYYTSDGTFVKSDDALIDYNPILPNQTSPFEVITTDNPAIKRYSVSFKFLFGGTIPTEDKR